MIERLAAALLVAAALVPSAAHRAPTHATFVPGAVNAGQTDDVELTISRAAVQRREIALTFDDGPYPFYTPLLLHILGRSNVPATFFLVGRSAQQFPELVDRIVRAGDEIGNHTFNHYKLTTLSAPAVTYQIVKDDRVLRGFTHQPLTLFRPPHGGYNERIVTIAHSLGYTTVLWSDSPEDYKHISPALEMQRVLRYAAPGGIVLLHSGEFRTIEALPLIIAALREQGYTFVTVGQLMRDGEAAETTPVQPGDTTP